MKTVMKSVCGALLTGLLIWGCAMQEEQKTLENAVPETVTLEVDLGGSSRAERFLGTFDEIERLALEIKRNFDNREVVTDFALTRDNTSRWQGTIHNLIVSFDYTITGHAYKSDNSPDNTSAYVEIFRGETQHTVNEGTNALSLRLVPMLDERNLSVPRITRINRPFQLEKTDNGSILVTVINTDLQPLLYRFRSIDNQSLPKDPLTGGSFNPEKGTHTLDNSSTYPDIATTYSAPDLPSAQDLQVRVSNEQEIGVTVTFKVYVTGPIESETTVDANPVIESLSAERIDNSSLEWTVLVSDDEPFNSLDVSWEYLLGEPRVFDNFTLIDLTDASRPDVGVGRMQAVMQGYRDTDDGILRVTVCETDGDNYTLCQANIDGATTVDFELIPYAYQPPVICDGTSCSSTFEGTWVACSTGGFFSNNDQKSTFTISGSTGQYRHESFNTEQGGSDNGSCVGTVGMIFNHQFTFVEGNQVTVDNQSATQVDVTIQSSDLTFYDLNWVGHMTRDNSTTLCGYSDWAVGVAKDVTGCADLEDMPPAGEPFKEIMSINDNNTLRMGDQKLSDNATGGFPTNLGCEVFAPLSAGYYPPMACEWDNSYSSSGTWQPFSSMVAIASGSIPVGGSILSGSYASYCMPQNWGTNGPSDMRAARYATVVTDNASVSDETYLYSDDNCSSLIAYEISAWDNVSVDNYTSAYGSYSVSATESERSLYAGTTSGADWLNGNYSGWGEWTAQGNIGTGEYRTLGGNTNYTAWNRWIFDNSSFRRSWWRDNSSSVDDPSTQPELYHFSSSDNATTRYTDNGDGTVTDNQHNLMWQKQDDAIGRNWSEAAAYCSGLSLAGYNDWWLPSKDQLFSLVDRAFYPTIDTAYFLNTQSSNYWSSTTLVSNTSYAWYVYFNNGGVYNYNKTNNYYARCVRGGQ